MEALALVLEKPHDCALRSLSLDRPVDGDAVVRIDYTGISTGTERLIWSGTMPPFPGMGFPLVPGYEAVGTVLEAPSDSKVKAGDQVFIPGARCFGTVHGLFGAAASKLVTNVDRLVPIPKTLGQEGILIALAATAHHALTIGGLPELIIGHGVLGRLMARISTALGISPIVWETNPDRITDDTDYLVIDPKMDKRDDYGVVIDASGDPAIIDSAAPKMAAKSLFVLAGFYHTKIAFDFAPAFMRQLTIRIAAEWAPGDLTAVVGLLQDHPALFNGIITHTRDAREGVDAYQQALEDADCLKMVLDWRSIS